MAIVVESTANSGAYATTAVITKPTGLAVGDTLIAVISANTNTTTSINTPAGWTKRASQALSTSDVAIFSKVADAGDVAASNFTFTDTGGVRIVGGLLRVSGLPNPNNIGDTETDTYDSTETTAISFTTSLTPIRDGSLIVIGIAAMQGSASGTGSMSGYTSTPSLTFTEFFDQGVELGNNVDPQSAGIYAIQTTATEITQYTATLNFGRARHIGVAVVFTPQIDSTGENTLVTTTSTTFASSGSADALGTSVLEETTSEAFEQSGRGTSPTQWSNEAKPSTTWTNDTL